MNPKLQIPFVISILLIATSFILTPSLLVGKWRGKSEGEIGFIQFYKDGYVSFISEGKEVGGKKYSMDGMDVDMTYETNETVTPHTMDFIIRLHKDTAEITRLTGIYKFVNDNTLIINMNFEGLERPSLFDPEDPNQITLHRVK